MINNYKILTREHIKLLAAIAMFIDHFGYIFYSKIPHNIYFLCRDIGRIACPIFLVLFVQGMINTKKPIKHLLILFIFTILSEPAFDLMCSGSLFSVDHQSIMLSLLLCGIMIVLFRKIEKTENWLKFSLIFILTCIFSIISTILKVDYEIYIVIACTVAYIVWNQWPQLQAWIICLLVCIIEFLTYFRWPIFYAIPIMMLYDNHKRTKNTKIQQYGFYAFYPIHIFVLCLLYRII